MSGFTDLIDLASERLGGVVLAANDEFFAPKENLLKSKKPIFIEDKYTDRGKWMDGWETRRRRTPGHDFCVIRLGLPGVIRGVVVDTSHFKGNYPEHCSLEARAFEEDDDNSIGSSDAGWTELLPKSSLQGDTLNLFAVVAPHRYTHLRFHIYPDGGVARLRVHGEPILQWRKLLAGTSEIDLAAAVHGGWIVDCSDKFFSSPQNLIMPGRGMNMGDGWETRRRRGPGFDWVIVKLGIAGTISRVEVDTAHFKGNYPESCSLETCNANSFSPDISWHEVLPRTKLQPDSRHAFEVRDGSTTRFVRFNIFPDGGVSRLRIFGRPTAEGFREQLLRWLNALPTDDFRAALLDCCGSRQWTEGVLQARPFGDRAQLHAAADSAFAQLGPDDWLEAFRAHPPIGGKHSANPQSARAGHWSQREQAGMAAAPAAVSAAMAEANHQYVRRFGYVFIICASGKTAEEMLIAIQERLRNDPEKELRVAASEQQEITRLRLEKLLTL